MEEEGSDHHLYECERSGMRDEWGRDFNRYVQRQYDAPDKKKVPHSNKEEVVEMMPYAFSHVNTPNLKEQKRRREYKQLVERSLQREAGGIAKGPGTTRKKEKMMREGNR